MNYKQAEKIVENVAAQLKVIRQEQGVSHEVLAKKIGVSRPAISHIESGKRKPSLLTTVKIAHGLDVKVSSLLKMFEK